MTEAGGVKAVLGDMRGALDREELLSSLDRDEVRRYRGTGSPGCGGGGEIWAQFGPGVGRI